MVYFYATLLENLLVSQNVGRKLWGTLCEGAKCESLTVGAQSVWLKVWGVKCKAQRTGRELWGTKYMGAKWVNPFISMEHGG